MFASPGDAKQVRLNLAASLETSDRRQRLVILVHGYRTLERPVADQYRSVARAFRERAFPGILVAYDWPSVAGFWEQSTSAMVLFFGPEEGSGIGPAGRWEIRGYLADRANAENVGGPSLARVITDLGLARPATRINVICFSMGCYVLQKALERLGGAIPRNIDALVFLAADIDRDTLPGIVRPTRPGQRVAVHFSREDSVLSVLSGMMNVGKARLGAAGPPSPVPAHVFAFDQTAALGTVGGDEKTPVHSRYLDSRYPVVGNVVDFLAERR